MNFFERQDDAKRKSARLVLYFAFAVAIIVAGVYAIVVVVASTLSEYGGEIVWWRPDLLAAVVFGVGGVILIGSLFKTMRLRQGGSAVAASLGGRPVSPNTADADERKLLNVVEEMAIASGTPMPEVYILPGENAINAFAAGYTTSDAAIAVTRGCVEKLTRDELQGVVAHEFSHILHGDMRLNIRLIGLLHGILSIGLIGLFLLRSLVFTGRSRNRSAGGLIVVFLAAGGALTVLGYAGVFFGRLIKAAVSRQREFLADASAVQFTRNPSGLSGALQKIGGFSRGARLESRRAEEASHMFFGNGTRRRLLFRGLLATHPPLERRIQAIDPGFDGAFTPIDDSYYPPVEREAAVSELAAGAGSGAPEPASPAEKAVTTTPDALVSSVGRVTSRHLAYGAALLDSLPDAVRSAAREPYGSRAVVYALLLDANAEIRERQLAALQASVEPPVYAQTVHLAQPIAALGARARLPLVDIALPALRRLSPRQHAAFAQRVEMLIDADQKVSLFEFALRKVLMRHLSLFSRRAPIPGGGYGSLRAVREELQVALSTLAYGGHGSVEAAQSAFAASASRLGPDFAGFGMAPPSVCSLTAFDVAIDRLAQLQPRPKEAVLSAAAECVAHDGVVTVEEGELLRAIADSLDCPMPPLLG